MSDYNRGNNTANGAGANTKVEALNEILSLEYAAFHQYTQHSLLVQGLDRYDFKPFFEEQAEGSYKHALLIGSKVVSYGGVPVIEAGPIEQSTDLLQMLEQDLAMERKLRDAYINAIPLAEADNDVPLRFLLEKQAYNEQEDVEELEKYLSKERIVLQELDIPDTGSQAI
ncbi:MAG: Ferritin-like domain protein [Chloroflexi bacterium]|jgi:bacterioferritin (cytochrome b1)|nr:Ferritin-like domain protein [Chloroflexota bacterium]